MQVMPSGPFGLQGLLHQQFLARGIAAAPPPPAPAVPAPPATPPSSEDNMSPPPSGSTESYDKQGSQYDRERPRDFKCPLCGDNMTSLKEFTSHLRSHNEVKPSNDPSDPSGQTKVYHCCLCGKMLSSFSSLDRHMLVHSGERPFPCEVCGQTFTTNGNMHRHRRTHNIRDSCESDGSGGSGGKRSRKRKVATISADHESLPAKKPDNDVVPSPAGGLAFAAPLKCPICPDNFYSELSLEVHVISFHPGREIKCDECGHPCPTYNYFKLHRNMFHFKFGASFPAAAPSFPLLLPEKRQQQQQLSIPPHFSPIKEQQQDTSSLIEVLPNEAAHNTSFCSDNGTDDDPALREMKLKGEFPCRLCPSVFPNLRALKGHNKEHLLCPPYECNVGTCHYSTPDKSNLLQHMRSHTGQKPFECKICNFGFTTKANCERHVKNKHNKNSKEEVRDHIIIQEGDENESGPAFPGSVVGDLPKENILPRHETSSFDPESSSVYPPTPPRSSAFIPYRPFEVDTTSSDAPSDDAPLDLSKPAGPAAASLSGEPCKASSDAGIDLSGAANEGRTDMSKERPVSPPQMPATGAAPGFPFPLPFLQGGPAGAPLWPPPTAAFPFNTMHHLAALLAAKNESLKKHNEAMQARETAAALQNLSQIQDLASQRSIISQISPSSSSVSTNSPQNSPHKPPTGGDQDKYKMVIKNGILMRKQKQRRYRTERPYGCERCNARFTLRSNMDRHVKQQHPEVYSQKLTRLAPTLVRPTAMVEDKLETITAAVKEEEKERGYRSEVEEEEEEEGYLEEEDEQNLIIDDKTREDGQTFKNISQFFNGNQGLKGDDCDNGSESSAGSSDDKKKSAYSATPHKMACPICLRKFPWNSSLQRHILTHTGQKPFKCTECPLWFTTKSNCDRHIQRKHANNNGEGIEDDDDEEEEAGFMMPRRDSTSSSAGSPGDSPYKCHICEDGFSERDTAICHIREAHPEEFKELESKGAFDVSEETPAANTPAIGDEDLYDNLRGKFPDYVNRKIICLFCSHKFWSAEDLRRHVRTHTGERPFSCDICNRRFTLKHSMLRHKKKHDSGVSSGGDASDDESSGVSSNGGGSSGEEVYDKKRANLMEKINRLNSSELNGVQQFQ